MSEAQQEMAATEMTVHGVRYQVKDVASPAERGLHGEGQQKRFSDSGGWGYAVFDYNAASDTFTPGTTAGPRGQRRQVRLRVSHEGEGERLRLYWVPGKR